MTDIPTYSKLKGSIIEIEINGEASPVFLAVKSASRGQGNKKYFLAVEGLMQAGPNLNQQCYVQFRGERICGGFEGRILTHGDMRLVTFTTIISSSAFWE